MALLKEARFLYSYSRELVKLNKKLSKLGRRAEQHKVRHGRASEDKKQKHKVKHVLTMREINKMKNKHNQLIMRLRTHHQHYAHYLRKEHSV